MRATQAIDVKCNLLGRGELVGGPSFWMLGMIIGIKSRRTRCWMWIGMRTKRADVSFKTKANLVYWGYKRGDLRRSEEKRKREGQKSGSCWTFPLA